MMPTTTNTARAMQPSPRLVNAQTHQQGACVVLPRPTDCEKEQYPDRILNNSSLFEGFELSAMTEEKLQIYFKESIGKSNAIANYILSSRTQRPCDNPIPKFDGAVSPAECNTIREAQKTILKETATLIFKKERPETYHNYFKFKRNNNTVDATTVARDDPTTHIMIQNIKLIKNFIPMNVDNSIFTDIVITVINNIFDNPQAVQDNTNETITRRTQN